MNRLEDFTMYGENAYLSMVADILSNGVYRKPADEEGRYELFAQPLKFDLSRHQLPLMTTKFTWFKGAAVEMLWFISGATNTEMLKAHKVGIWDTWENDKGEVGPLYGHQWRHWATDPRMVEKLGLPEEIDQLANVIEKLRTEPEARSHMVTAWRPDHLKAMSIKPCHVLYQFYLVDGKLSLALYQRSCDTFLGVPFNIAQYSLLCHMVAHLLGVETGEFTWIGGDTHIYENHAEQMHEQLKRIPARPPRLFFNRTREEIGSIDGFRFEDFAVVGYEHHGKLKGEVSAQGQPGQGIDLNALEG